MSCTRRGFPNCKGGTKVTRPHTSPGAHPRPPTPLGRRRYFRGPRRRKSPRRGGDGPTRSVKADKCSSPTDGRWKDLHPRSVPRIVFDPSPLYHVPLNPSSIFLPHCGRPSDSKVDRNVFSWTRKSHTRTRVHSYTLVGNPRYLLSPTPSNSLKSVSFLSTIGFLKQT